MKRRTLLTIVQYIIFLGLGVAIIYRMLDQMSAQDKIDMVNSIKQTRLWMLIPVFIAAFLSHLFRSLRWKLLLKPLHIEPTTANTTFSVLIGYLVNLLLPRMGEVAKCTVLARYEHVPADKMVGTIVAERAFDVLCLIIVTIFAFLLQADVIGNYASSIFIEIVARKWLLGGVLTGLAFLILFLVFLYRRNKHTKVGQFLLGIKDGIYSIMQMKTRGLFLLYSFLIWSMYLLQVQIGFWSMPATEHLGILTALVVLIFGSVGMIVTPGGLGAYPALIANILGFYGLSVIDGNAFGWMSWAAQTGVLLVLGIISLILLPIYNRKGHHAQASVDTKKDS